MNIYLNFRYESVWRLGVIVLDGFAHVVENLIIVALGVYMENAHGKLAAAKSSSMFDFDDAAGLEADGEIDDDGRAENATELGEGALEDGGVGVSGGGQQGNDLDSGSNLSSPPSGASAARGVTCQSCVEKSSQTLNFVFIALLLVGAVALPFTVYPWDDELNEQLAALNTAHHELPRYIATAVVTLSTFATLSGAIYTAAHAYQLQHLLLDSLRPVKEERWAQWLPCRVVGVYLAVVTIAAIKGAGAAVYIFKCIQPWTAVASNCEEVCRWTSLFSHNCVEFLYVLLFIVSRSPDKCCGLCSVEAESLCVPSCDGAAVCGKGLRALFEMRKWCSNIVPESWIKVLEIDFLRSKTYGVKNEINMVRSAKWRFREPPKRMPVAPKRERGV